jgi:cell division protein FtsB
MEEYKNKILPYIERYSDARVVGLLAFGVVALLVTWSGIKVVQTNYELEKKIAISRQRNEIKELENQNLKLKNQYYQSSQYLELSARRQFGKAGPGEKLYNIPRDVALGKTVDPLDTTQATQVVPVARTASNKYQQNLQDWLSFLFH